MSYLQPTPSGPVQPTPSGPVAGPMSYLQPTKKDEPKAEPVTVAPVWTPAGNGGGNGGGYTSPSESSGGGGGWGPWVAQGGLIKKPLRRSRGGRIDKPLTGRSRDI